MASIKPVKIEMGKLIGLAGGIAELRKISNAGADVEGLIIDIQNEYIEKKLKPNAWVHSVDLHEIFDWVDHNL